MSVVKKRFLAPVSSAATRAIKQGFWLDVVQLIFELLPADVRFHAADRAARFAVSGEWVDLPVEGELSTVRYRGYSFRRRGGYWTVRKMVSGRRYHAYVGVELTRPTMDAAIAKIREKMADS